MNKRLYRDKRQINIVNVNAPQDSNAPEENNYNLLKDEFNSKQDTVDESSTMIENRTFEIASGGLVLSLTVLSFLDTHNRLPEGWRWMSVAIWTAFTLCILFHFWSHYVARHSAERTRDQIGEMMRKGEKYDAQRIDDIANKESRLLRFINFLTPLCLMLGIIGLVAFTSVCILIQ